MAVKLVPQVAPCEFAYVFPQAVIVPGDVASAKLEGADWKVTDSNNPGVVEERVCVAD